MSSAPATQITLRALEGQPLDDRKIRDTVVATAHAIAERQGVAVLALSAQADRITVTLDTGRIEAIGFAAELRRLTTRWYAQKFGDSALWGEPPPEEGEEWKRA
jgi:hypothetical protein